MHAVSSRWFTVLIIGGTVLVSFVIQFCSTYHRHQNGDSILYSVMSYTDPALYYWGQDRLFTPFARLLAFIHDASWNCIAHTAVHIAAMILGIFLFCKFLTEKHAALCFGVTLSMLAATANTTFWFMYSYQPYALSFFFATLSIVMLRNALAAESRLTAVLSAPLLMIGCAIAQPIIVFYGCWLLYWLATDARAKLVCRTTRKGAVRRVLLPWTIAALVSFVALRRIWRSYIEIHQVPTCTYLLFTSLEEWRDGLARMLLRYVNGFTTGGWLTIGLCGGLFVALLFACLCLPALRRRGTFLAVFLCAIVPSIVWIAVMASLVWVKYNAYCPRYIMSAGIVLFATLAFLMVRCLETYWRPATGARTACGVIVLAFALFLIKPFGFTLTATAPADRIASAKGIPIAALKACGCHALIGNYWRVWPAVFVMNATYPDWPFYGVTFRAMHNKRQWHDLVMQDGRLCAYRGDGEYALFMADFFPNVPYTVEEQGPLVVIHLTSQQDADGSTVGESSTGHSEFEPWAAGLRSR